MHEHALPPAQSTPHSEMPFRVLLYYNFCPIGNPDALRDEMEAKCRDWGLLGRILIAAEGLNGTVSGPVAATQAYVDYLHAHPILGATEFKIDPVPGHTFNKLHVRVKQEIVHLGVEKLDMDQVVDNYVEPEEFRAVLEEDAADVVILDARSNYEHEVGRFRNAITLDIENFRELPEKLAELEAYKDKKIYTYCTGGIKCEKVSRLMLQAGFPEVYQLHGGIIRYAHETGGAHFEGSCYVFDQRVVVPVNEVNPKVVGACQICAGPTEKMINCANPECNDHFLICDTCADSMAGTCSQACHDHPRRRAWDGRGYYLRGVNSKLYEQNPDPNYSG
ncbi:MAG: rhodanese-related sulfurtransferase [Bacteroidota bacterium]